jgi:cytochrome c-type biogenesis protein CcmE
MAEIMWEKPQEDHQPSLKPKGKPKRGNERLKFLIGGILILGAIAFLILSGTMGGARFFITVDDVINDPAYMGQTVRLTGAVIGESIVYDAETGTIEFDIAHLPDANETEDLAVALHDAANNPDATRLSIFITDQAMPDLLQHEAQAILTGQLGDDGVFYATELLLKCPSRFEEGMPGGMNPIDSTSPQQT